MSLLLHGDCLEHMKGIDTDSVDFIFCDLPYGQTSCKWDCQIDLDKFWIEVMRVKKINTPIFMTTTTKFGVSLINSAPKKCPFRYDLVWVKSAPAGFLSAKKMPMRKHEMVYVFYEKLPFYDLSSHTHKFLNSKNGMKGQDNLCYGSEVKQVQNKQYDPPLHVSVVKEDERKINPKNSNKGGLYSKIERLEDVKYDPPLPVSVVKEEDKGCYGEKVTNSEAKYGQKCARQYDPPLPTTMLEIKSTRGKHSTEKPVALMEWLLKYYSKEGDVVLDPTMGSGSTGVACKNMNRNFIGIEKDPEIYEVAVNRIEP
jgi:site-specific DNA-methyltransferase (adenine-specific)